MHKKVASIRLRLFFKNYSIRNITELSARDFVLLEKINTFSSRKVFAPLSRIRNFVHVTPARDSCLFNHAEHPPPQAAS